MYSLRVPFVCLYVPSVCTLYKYPLYDDVSCTVRYIAVRYIHSTLLHSIVPSLLAHTLLLQQVFIGITYAIGTTKRTNR